MRLRHIALGCTLTGALGCLALPPVAARAAAGAPDNTTLRISAPMADYRYGATVRFTVELGPTFADRKVALYASPYGQARRLVATANVDVHGRWHPAYKVTRATSFTVVYDGDAHNSATSAGLTLQVYARVANRIGGYVKMARVGSVSYAVYRGSGTLTLYSTVTPAKHGECLQPESQQLNGSTWGADTKYGCDKLDTASHDAAPFTLTEAIGDRYRIRGDYFRSTADRANLDAQGPWLYFEVVS